MTPTLSSYVFFAFVALSVAALFVAIFLPGLAGDSRLKRRRDLALGLQDSAGHLTGGKTAGSARHVRKSVEDTLRELEEKAKADSKGRTSLSSRLYEAGLSHWSRATYAGVSIAAAGVMSALLWVGFGMGAIASAGFGVAAGVWFPHAVIARRIKQRRAAFTAAFPDAVDMIVRGVKSGIPLTDCLRIVATDASEPVRTEFQTMIEDLTMGLSVEEAVQRMAERVKLEEARFLSIVITIQSKTGGNLSEALGNLSVVLRDRAKMRGKIRAMSSEARASAVIIGALPPLVCFLVFLSSPDYVGLLFTTLAGNIVLIASGLWMLCGVVIMRQMINFDF